MGLASLGLFFGYVFLFYVLQGAVAKLNKGVGVTRDSTSRYLMVLVSFGFVSMSESTLRNQNQVTLPGVRVAGFTLVVAGLLLSMSAQRALGSNWLKGVGLHRHHMLVTTGPYRYVRHPLYTGIAISQLGIALFSMNRWMDGACFFLACFFILRVPEEEALLSKRFGKQFELYCTQTGLFLPKISRIR
jgi:protein-S-isoprenylcysteine O-methyltransferase Ste14